MLAVPAAAPGATPSSWWFASDEALPVLKEGASALRSLAASQPPGSPTRTLSEVVARLLRRHYHALAAEAQQAAG